MANLGQGQFSHYKLADPYISTRWAVVVGVVTMAVWVNYEYLVSHILRMDMLVIIGMAFFLLSVFVSMVADGRFIGAFFASLIHDHSTLDAIQGAAAGLSLPLSCASIFFNLRGLVLFRFR